jgi:outer membrane protein assembly factor BamB
MFGARTFPNWIGTLTAGSNIYGGSAVADSSGNIYVTGSNGTGGTTLYFQKLNSTGVIQFQKQLQTFADGVDIAIDTASNLYIANNEGSSNGIGVIKYDSSGTLQWQRKLVPAYNPNRTQGIAVDSSNNVYVVGTVVTTSGGRNDLFLAKYNSSGSLQWQRLINAASNNTTGSSIQVSSSGNVYVAGTAVPSSNFDMFVAKYDTSGTIQWQRSIDNSSSYDQGRSLAIDSSENVYVVGGTAFNAFVVTKLNTSGTLQWSRTLSATNADPCGSAVDSAGNVYLLGMNYVGPNQCILAKYNTSGTIQWQRSFTDIFFTSAVFNRLKITSSGSVLFVMAATVSTRDSQVVALVPSDGSKTGTYTIGSLSTTYAASSLTDAAGSFTATASSLTTSTPSLTDSATSLTESNTSFTQTTTLI